MSGHSSDRPVKVARIRNAWKGLVIGGLTGVAAGLAIDFVDATTHAAQQGAARAADAVSDHLPDAIDKTKEAATRATHVVADKAPDIAGTLTNAAIDFVDATTHAAQRARPGQPTP